MKYGIRILFAVLLFLTANLSSFAAYGAGRSGTLWIAFCIVTGACYILIHLFPSAESRHMPLRRHRICMDGCELLILFLISSAFSCVYVIVTTPKLFGEHMLLWVVNLITVVLAETLVFWNGIIRVYCTSAQIGICTTKYPLLMVHGVFFGILSILTIGDGFRMNWSGTEP